MNDEDKIILTTWKQWFEVPTAILCKKGVFCVVAQCGWLISSQNFEETNRLLKFLSHFSDEAGTSPRNLRKHVHNHTAQQPASSIWEQGCSEWNLSALCHTSTSNGNLAALLAIFIVAVFVLFISLHIKTPRRLALIIFILNIFKEDLWITFHSLALSLSLSFCLIHTSSKVGSEYSAKVGF